MKQRFHSVLVAALLVALAACAAPLPSHTWPTVGRVTSYDASFSAIVASDARIEKIAEGITWAEGPTWVRQDGGYLLFTDVPQNKLYRWSAKDGLSVLLEPSGYVGPDDGTLREAGANGLFAEPRGTVLLADSGSRAVARLDPRTKAKTMLATKFEGKRFNSPNDVVRRRDGMVFFTDPPYGLKGIELSPVRELTFSGVYRLDTDGTVHLLDDSLKFPNGVTLSPDERRLYVSNSDPSRPVWMVYSLDARGNVIDKRVFADATDLVRAGAQGNPDGMCMAADGKLFTSAPGGLLVFDPDGRRLGRIETGSTVSNCEFGDDGRTLYMTSSNFIARVRVGVAGLGFSR
jgi:gluconolactonase